MKNPNPLEYVVAVFEVRNGDEVAKMQTTINGYAKNGWRMAHTSVVGSDTAHSARYGTHTIWLEREVQRADDPRYPR